MRRITSLRTGPGSSARNLAATAASTLDATAAMVCGCSLTK